VGPKLASAGNFELDGENEVVEELDDRDVMLLMQSPGVDEPRMVEDEVDKNALSLHGKLLILLSSSKPLHYVLLMRFLQSMCCP
jgi:hypothetical protein